jgi:hypothetical protein
MRRFVVASRSAIVSLDISAGSQVIHDSPATYYGVTVRNTSAVSGVIRIWDNAAAASGVLLETVTVPASNSFNIQYNVEDQTGGIRAVNGVYFELVSGTFEGSIRVSG